MDERVPRPAVPPATSGAGGLRRDLRPRHVPMLALGMAVGVGLFLGAGEGIEVAGPGLLLAYAAAGAVAYVVLRALGEMAVHSPEVGSFSLYALRHIGPWAGFVTGWTYWLLCVTSPMVELTACGIYVRYWFPSLPPWLPALGGLVLVFALHRSSVRWFGELEYWFAMIKVLAIVGLIVLGVIVVIGGVTMLGRGATVSNLWRSGGFLPHGLGGVVLTLPIAVFAFGGVEMLGITAGEAAAPERTIPRAVRSVMRRVAVLYLGALAVLMVVQPWTVYTGAGSPFVSVLAGTGIVGAAGLLNAVVLLAALSSCNATVFAASRLLVGMSRSGSAPRRWARTSSAGVPVAALWTTVLAVAVGVLVDYVAPERAFATLTSVVSVAGMWTWGVIAYSHLRFRRRRRRDGVPPDFALPGYPWTNLVAIAATVAVVASLAFSAEGRTGLWTSLAWGAVLTVVYLARRPRTG